MGVRRTPTRLARLVAEYIRVQRPRAEASWAWHASAGALKEAIRRAAASVREDGEVEEPQRDVPRRMLLELGGRIALRTPARIQTFDELFALVHRAAPAHVPLSRLGQAGPPSVRPSWSTWERPGK